MKVPGYFLRGCMCTVYDVSLCFCGFDSIQDFNHYMALHEFAISGGVFTAQSGNVVSDPYQITGRQLGC